jgi:hypothetical protein
MDPRYRPRNEREEEVAKAYGSASYENALADILAVLHGGDLEPTRSTKRRQLRAATLEADDERVKRVARIVATATVKLCRSLQRRVGAFLGASRSTSKSSNFLSAPR